MNVQKGVGSVMQSAVGVTSDIYSDVNKTMCYSSYFIPAYNNFCQGLIIIDMEEEAVRELIGNGAGPKSGTFLNLNEIAEDIKGKHNV